MQNYSSFRAFTDHDHVRDLCPDANIEEAYWLNQKHFGWNNKADVIKLILSSKISMIL